MPTIEAEMTLLSTAEGGRQHPLALDPPSNYRPHLVVGSPDFRPPVRTGDSAQREDYLGVIFLSCPSQIPLGSSFTGTMGLVYHPDVDYSALVPGATFTIRESSHVVGYGRVTKRAGEHTI